MLTHSETKFFKLAVGADRIGKETNVDISARCPICGDSAKKKASKRLHLYSKNNNTRVNCFNGDCSVNNKTMYGFLKDFFPSLFNQYKRENFSDTLLALNTSGSTETVSDVFAHLGESPDDSGGAGATPTHKSADNIRKAEIVTQDLSVYMKEIQEVPEALAYLKIRGVNYNAELYGEWYFGYQDLKIGETIYKITDSIVIPLYYNNEMYGFYSRNIREKVFYTHMHDANIGYKVWNWFNVDVSEPVYIFEGIFDAISSGLPNVIALLGAKLPNNRLAELKSPVFVLDNDKTGLINSLQYAKAGHNIYIQPNEFQEKDMNELNANFPDLDLSNMIKSNIYQSILAEVKIKAKL